VTLCGAAEAAPLQSVSLSEFVIQQHERVIKMLDELEQQYTSLKTKVHDLREYL